MDINNNQLRKCAFGGFDRRDVVSYIERLAAERNGLKDENERLRSRVDELEDKLNESKQLAAYIEELENKLKNAEEGNDADSDNSGGLQDLVDIITELEDKYRTVKADIDITTTHTQCELNKMKDQISSINSAMESAGRKISDLKSGIAEKQ